MQAKILSATRPYKGSKQGLISFQIECPLYVWTELLTHRRFARNASSNRAMSTERTTSLGFYTPDTFFTQGTGMMSSYTPVKHQKLARFIWEWTTRITVFSAKLLERLEVAKEQRNRLIPTNKIIRALVTGTEDAWNAFLLLRNHPTADKAMQELARMIFSEIAGLEQKYHFTMGSGQRTDFGEEPIFIVSGASPYMRLPGLITDERVIDKWTYAEKHSPFPGASDVSTVANCARVSYARSSGKNDQQLYDTLLSEKHMSPFEHIAYWTSYPRDCALNCKEEDIAHAQMGEGSSLFAPHGWETFRSRLEEGLDKSEEAVTIE